MSASLWSVAALNQPSFARLTHSHAAFCALWQTIAGVLLVALPGIVMQMILEPDASKQLFRFVHLNEVRVLSALFWLLLSCCVISHLEAYVARTRTRIA